MLTSPPTTILRHPAPMKKVYYLLQAPIEAFNTTTSAILIVPVVDATVDHPGEVPNQVNYFVVLMPNLPL